jgi:hypothetical protein
MAEIKKGNPEDAVIRTVGEDNFKLSIAEKNRLVATPETSEQQEALTPVEEIYQIGAEIYEYRKFTEKNGGLLRKDIERHEALTDIRENYYMEQRNSA